MAENTETLYGSAPPDLNASLDELAAVGFSLITDVAQWDADGVRVVPWDEIPARSRAGVKSVRVRRRREVEGHGRDAIVWEVEEVEVTMHDKLKALELLGKHLGLV